VAVITTVITAIIVGTALRVIVCNNPDALTSKFFTVQLLNGAISIFAGQVFQDAVTNVVAINIGEGYTSCFTTEVFQVLPARVTRDARDNKAESRGPSSSGRTVSGLIGVFPRSALFRELDHNISTHKTLSIERVQCIFSIPRVFELDKTKASHNTNVNDSPIAVKKFCDVI
jgi:hypothetical protein